MGRDEVEAGALHLTLRWTGQRGVLRIGSWTISLGMSFLESEFVFVLFARTGGVCLGIWFGNRHHILALSWAMSSRFLHVSCHPFL